MLGRRNAPVIYPVGSIVSLTTKSSKGSLWVEIGILHFHLLSSDPVIKAMM